MFLILCIYWQLLYLHQDMFWNSLDTGMNFKYTFKILLVFILKPVFGYPIYPGDNANLVDLITYYRSLPLTCIQILAFLSLGHNIFISLSTLNRILKRLNIKRHTPNVDISLVINSIRHLHCNGFKNTGYRTIWNLLNVYYGINVSQELVRLSLHIIDEDGIVLRRQRCLNRRQYVNRGPNYLIHLDGYDKLKPFGIAIHGAIDGYSRRVLWLKAGPSNNNPRFIERFYMNYIIKTQKIPRCVRMDAGTENVIVRDIQNIFGAVQERENEIFAIVGRSNRNQRIERFWGTLRNSVIQFWRDYFREMQDSELFNADDPLEIQILRFCFINCVQNQLNIFRKIWNIHNIRAQRSINTPTGIPNVLYYLPETAGAVDQGFALPCEMGVIEDIKNEFSSEYPIFGCEEDFVQLVETLTGYDRTVIVLPQTAEDSRDMFVELKQSIYQI